MGLNIQLPFPSMLPESNWVPPDTFPSFSQNKWIDIDLETCDPQLRTRGPGFIRGDAFIAGVAISTDGFSGYYPVRHLQGNNLAPNVVFEWLRDEFKYFHGEVYGANLIYELEGLYFEGVHINDDCKFRDAQIAEPLIDEETSDGYSLEVLSNKYLGIGKDEELLRQAASRYTSRYKDKRARRPVPFDPKGELWKLPAEFVGPYAQGDVDRPHRIFEKQSKIFDKDDLWDIFKLESELLPILLRMRIQGVRVDLEAAERLVKLLTKEIDKYSLQIKRLVGFDVNLNSGKEVLKAYETYGYAHPDLAINDRIRYLPTGNPSFTADWYTSQNDPLSLNILRKKKLSTLRDNFIVGDIIKESVDGRVHAQFHQLRGDDQGTRSGRFSSTNPNLQQVPNRFDDDLWDKDSPKWPEEVRKLFIPEKGMKWLKSDYSQQEPRLLVHFAFLCGLSGAEEAVEAFKKNPLLDYHQLCTDIVNAKSGKNFKRKQIKGINLGVMYSMGIAKLCRMLGVSVEEGASILKAYHAALPFVKGLSNKATETAAERGWIRTLLSRLRRFNLWEPVPESKEERQFKVQGLPRELAEKKWPRRRLQRFGTHKALNALIQGSAGDQTKVAMHILYYVHKIVPHIQVHDELNGSVVDIEQARIYKRTMEQCVELALPVVADSVLGDSWGSAKEKVELLAA